MKITVEIDGKRHRARLPHEHATYVVIDVKCAGCGCEPMYVSGSTQHVESHDTYAARAYCACGKPVGTIRAQMSTIFGIEEDARVLSGRCRVY